MSHVISSQTSLLKVLKNKERIRVERIKKKNAGHCDSMEGEAIKKSDLWEKDVKTDYCVLARVPKRRSLFLSHIGL